MLCTPKPFLKDYDIVLFDSTRLWSKLDKRSDATLAFFSSQNMSESAYRMSFSGYETFSLQSSLAWNKTYRSLIENWSEATDTTRLAETSRALASQTQALENKGLIADLFYDSGWVYDSLFSQGKWMNFLKSVRTFDPKINSAKGECILRSMLEQKDGKNVLLLTGDHEMKSCVETIASTTDLPTPAVTHEQPFSFEYVGGEQHLNSKPF